MKTLELQPPSKLDVSIDDNPNIGVRALTDTEQQTVSGGLWNPFGWLGRRIGSAAYDAAHYYCGHPK